GDAQVSLKHANFIVNLGSARFADYVKVIITVREKVFVKFGIWLGTEINLVGEES
ncbi:MAG: UDP-N-acetylenolpyruvoylglucosamine reductase, partial [Firmicutes bacterium HGW-Firmicutes-13]